MRKRCPVACTYTPLSIDSVQHTLACCMFNRSLLHLNPITIRKAKTPQSFGHSECNRVKEVESVTT